MSLLFFQFFDRLHGWTFVIRCVLLVWRDAIQLRNVYPAMFRDARYRMAMGQAMVREGRKTGAGDIVEAGELLASEAADELFDDA
jgi:hypothetical protein